MYNLSVVYERDGLVEEKHNGWSVSTFNQFNSTVSTPFYLRSCAKPLQASLLIDYGLDDVYDLTLEEIAFMSASHAGEECHLTIAKRLLKKFGIKESDLKCGLHEPLSRKMQNKMLVEGMSLSTLYNNCSGKHIAFLGICKYKGWDISNYDDINHPLQIAVKNKINEICEVEENYPITTDGCGVPILSMPLKNLVQGMKNLFCSDTYEKIKNAFLQNSYIIGGENRLDTEIIALSDNLVAKVGAGGLCVVVNVDIGDAFVVKIEDSSMPARRIAVLELINKLKWADIDFDNTIKTLSGKKVGEIKVYIE